MAEGNRTPINPSLLIGLGGTGQKSLLAIRQRIMRTYGSVPPQIKLLSIDTTDREDDVRLVLRDDEFIKLEVKRVKEKVDANAAELEPWMDLDNIPFQSMKNIDRGAGQIRQLGRFSLMFRINDLLPVITKALVGINDWQVNDNDLFYSDATSPRQIVFFGSIAGGTGAGTLLDLACAIGSLPEASDYNRYAYLVMPGVYRGFPNCHYVEENGYAFLKELDFMLGEGRGIQRGDYGKVFDTHLGPLDYQMRQPFDNVMLVDSTNMADVSFSTPQSLAEAIAIAVFTSVGGAIGGSLSDVLVNPKNQGLPWEGGMLCQYSSFGVTELYYPRAECVAYGLAAFAEQIVDQMQLGQSVDEGDAGSADTSFDTFIRDEGLRERGPEQNDIIDKILSPKPYAAQVPKSDIRRDADVDEVWQRNIDAMAAYDDKVTRDAAAGRAAEVQRLSVLMASETERLLRDRGGVFALNFVSKIAGHFEAVRDELAAESVTAKSEADILANQLAGLRSECKDKAKKMIGRKDAVDKVLASYVETLRRRSIKSAHYKRTAEGSGLCQSVLTEIEGLQKTLAKQQVGVVSLGQKARAAVETARSGLSSPSPFQIPIQPDLAQMKLPAADARHFYAWLKGTQGLDALAFWTASADDAHKLLITYARAQDVHRGLQDATLTSVLESKSDAERQEYLVRADQRCQPLLSYDHGSEKLGRAAEDRPTSMYMVGAPKEFFDVFKNMADERGEAHDLGSRLTSLGVSALNEVLIADPERVYFFRYFGALPAYALGNFGLLRSEYLEMVKQERKWTLHLDKRWKDILPDLDPRTADNENLWVWAVASSGIDYLSTISKTGTFYNLDYIETLQDGSTQQVAIPIGQGVDQARKAFLGNRAWVDHTEMRIMAAIARVGNEKALADLDSYNQQLKADKAKAEKDRADDSKLENLQSEINAVAGLRVRLQR